MRGRLAMQNPRFRARALRTSLLFAALGGGATESRAADKFWGNTLGGAFSSAANWQNGVAGTGDVAHFGLSGFGFNQRFGYTVGFAARTTNQALVIEDDSVTFSLNAQTYATTLSPSIRIGTVGP